MQDTLLGETPRSCASLSLWENTKLALPSFRCGLFVSTWKWNGIRVYLIKSYTTLIRAFNMQIKQCLLNPLLLIAMTFQIASAAVRYVRSNH